MCQNPLARLCFTKAQTNQRAKINSIYMRPWVLDADIATRHVPHICDLDIVHVAIGVEAVNKTKTQKEIRCNFWATKIF